MLSEQPAPEEPEDHPAPEPIVPPLDGVLQNSDRLSWRTSWYYEQQELDTVEISSAGSILTRNKDAPPYSRVLARPGDSNRIPLDTGFVENPRVIIIENLTKWRGPFNPTDQQRMELAESRVNVYIGEEVVAILQPGQMQNFWISPEIAGRMTIQAVGAAVSRIKFVVLSE
jgi:hypothetical protein